MRKRNRTEEEVSEGAPEWIVTYSDLVTLLLTFFILLFSMATLDKQKFEEIANSLRSSFLKVSNGERFDYNKGKSVIGITPYDNAKTAGEQGEEQKKKEGPEKDNEKKNEENAHALQSVKIEIEEAISELGLRDHVKILEDKDQIILRLDSVILFNSGSAEIKPSGKDILKKMGIMFQKLNNEILVQGHTDNLPINTPLFPSNWELSTKRATNVVLYLIDACSLKPSSLTATGNGEFKPIAPNDSEQNRQKNRRIDIVISK
ncbi:MAG: OmpA family protein [Clostridia bacterium]|nr:OmpA family protein [Clostridia bacterium]